MPYIKDREFINEKLDKLLGWDYSEGQLNYIITKLLHSDLRINGVNYKTINKLIGVLECCKQELYRQIAEKYEDEKRIENGCISELDK